MKIKKIIAGIVLAGTICLSVTGCGDTVKNEYGEEVAKFGPYVEICHEKGKNGKGNYVYYYTTYNSQTKEMFEIVLEDGYGGMSIRQIWDYDEEGHPIVKYYEGEK